MEGENIFGEDLSFKMGESGNSNSQYSDVGMNVFNYETSNLETCEILRSTFNGNFQGIAKSQCDEGTLQMILKY